VSKVNIKEFSKELHVFKYYLLLDIRKEKHMNYSYPYKEENIRRKCRRTVLYISYARAHFASQGSPPTAGLAVTIKFPNMRVLFIESFQN
jgi:hypothetical protein